MLRDTRLVNGDVTVTAPFPSSDHNDIAVAVVIFIRPLGFPVFVLQSCFSYFVLD